MLAVEAAVSSMPADISSVTADMSCVSLFIALIIASSSPTTASVFSASSCTCFMKPCIFIRALTTTPISSARFDSAAGISRFKSPVATALRWSIEVFKGAEMLSAMMRDMRMPRIRLMRMIAAKIFSVRAYWMLFASKSCLPWNTLSGVRTCMLAPIAVREES